MSSADKKAIYTALLMLAQRTKASYETAVQALDGRKYRIQRKMLFHLILLMPVQEPVQSQQ